LTRTQQLVLEYHAFAVKRISEIIPVPESVQERLSGPNRLSPESDSPISRTDMSEDQEVAACNCPYCFLYTEDLTRFMEHLWDDHAKPIEEETQERKDSKFDEEIGQHPATDLEMRVAPASKQVASEKPQPQEPTNPTFWKSLLAAPVAIPGSHSKFKSKTTGHSAPGTLSPIEWLATNQVEAERKAQKVRDAIEDFYWFDPYPKKEESSPISTSKDPKAPFAVTNSTSSEAFPASPASKEESFSSTFEFKKPTISASKMKTKTPSPEENNSTFFEDYLSNRRYWICIHDEDCKKRFESLVLFIEHLNKHGYVVYKKWSELHEKVPSSKELLATGWGMAGF